MSEPVTMFGEELVPTRVLDDGPCMWENGDASFMVQRAGERISEKFPLGESYEAWVGHLHDGISFGDFPTREEAIGAAYQWVAALALRLPADVWARMVARREEVDRG